MMAMRLPPASILEIMCCRNSKRPIAGARRAGMETPVRVVGFVLDEVFFLFPAHTKRRVAQHIAEPLAFEFVLRETVALANILGILAHDQHIRFGDGVGLLVEFLPVHDHFHIRVDFILDDNPWR